MNRFAAIASTLVMLAATPVAAASVTVTVPDLGPYVDYGTGAGASVTYSGVTFTQLSGGEFYNVGPGFSGLPPVVSAQQGGAGAIQITLPTAANSISIVFGIFFNDDTASFTIGANNFSVPVTGAAGLYTTAFTFNSGTLSPFTTVTASSPQDGFQISSITFNTVPEPATWAMMITGFGLVGFAARRRTTTVAA